MNQPHPAAPPTCKRCGHDLATDINGVPFCAACRHAARTDDEQHLDRRTVSGVAFAHLPSDEQEN